MNKRDAKRVALYLNGHWLRATDTTGLPEEIEEVITLDDHDRIQDAITDIGLEMIRRSGLDEAKLFALFGMEVPAHRRER